MTPILILVDFQTDYFSGGAYPLDGIDTAAENAGRLLQCFRQHDLPRYHVQHIELDAEAEFFVPDTDGVKFFPALSPIENETIIVKHSPNAFLDTPLSMEIKNKEDCVLIFCGAMSHMCIDASVRAALDADFSCTVMHDACATRERQLTRKPAPNLRAVITASCVDSWGFLKQSLTFSR